MDKIRKFEFITQSMLETYKRKNADYGDSFGESVEELGLISAITRISDKCNRLKSLVKNPAKVSNESMEDTLLDLANYAVMTLIELETMEEIKEKNINIDHLIEMAKEIDVSDYNCVKHLKASVQDLWCKTRVRHIDAEINKLNDLLMGCVIVVESIPMTEEESLAFMIYTTELQSLLSSMILMHELSID